MSSQASLYLPRASASRKMSNVQFDPDGDVVLVIPSKATKGTMRFQVNSHSLCLASSVFRAMLGANTYFKEGNALRSRGESSPPIDITLEDDEPKALALILRIVHLQSDWVPRNLNDDQLYQVAIVCDKYDMRQVLGLWLDQWIPVNTQCGGNITGDRWLFISYAFGRRDLFTQLSKDLILTSTVDAIGSLLALQPPPESGTANGRRSFSLYIPPSIIVGISTLRKQAITQMLDSINQQIETYRDSVVPRCAHHTKTDLCDSFFFGFLQKFFVKLKVYPPTELHNRQTSMSIQEIKSLLDGLKCPSTIIFQMEDARYCSCGIAYTGSQKCNRCWLPTANHATTCSPILKLKGMIEPIFTSVHGLAWSQYVRNTKIDSAAAVPKNHDLWDYLKYS